MTTRHKLLWTALLIVATCAVVALGALVRPYVVAKYWGEEAQLPGPRKQSGAPTGSLALPEFCVWKTASPGAARAHAWR